MKMKEGNTELVSRLMTWMLVTMFLSISASVIDPLFGTWIPFYYPTKIAFVAWMVHPQTQGGHFLFVKHVEPAIRDLRETVAVVPNFFRRPKQRDEISRRSQ